MKTERAGSCTYIRYIDPESCTGCGACVAVCETGAIELADDVAVAAYPELCNGDGACRKACPEGAIY